jgi:thymidylate kinase
MNSPCAYSGGGPASEPEKPQVRESAAALRDHDAGGLFVALEGIDGGGKTTTAKIAAGVLCEAGYAAIAPDRASTIGASGYVARHMAGLRALIWDEPPDAPFLDLGDQHWVLLQAAWYSCFARCVVFPLLQSGSVVIADTWGQKFLAKLALRPPGVVDVDWARGLFAMVVRPDLTVHLRADPGRAAIRKRVLSGSETGDGTALTRASFAAYQHRVDEVLASFAGRDGWVDLDVSALSPGQAGEALADLIRHHLDGRAASGRAGGRRQAPV